LSELIIYWVVRAFGAFVQVLPIGVSLTLGKAMGWLAYHFNVKHRNIVLSNLKIAFAKTKTPEEIRRIAKETFVHYGQNVIELFRFPLMDTVKFTKFVQLDGREHIDAAMKGGKGVILLAMHFGSWEMANLIGATVGYPYKVLVKAQTKHSRLGELLNSFRRSGGSGVIHRGMGTRELIKSLQNNEMAALVVDQGGRDGALVPFFGKQASMSSGAIRLGLKLGIPICFVNITRQQGPYHRLIIDKPLDLVNTGHLENDVVTNLLQVVAKMEKCISQSPAQYMWSYKIWKYSKDAVIGIITDGKTGHLRQSEAVAGLLKSALEQRGVNAQLPILQVSFKSVWYAKVFTVLACFVNVLQHRGRVWLLRLCLTAESFAQVLSIKPDFIVSCGSAIAPVNYLLSREHDVKNIVILKPGLLNFNHFDLVVLPQHDIAKRKHWPVNVVVTQGAPNVITANYLKQQSADLLKRYSHLAGGDNFKIGVLLGGDTPEFVLSEQRVRILIHQLMEIAEEIPADILLTTSRRTSVKVENLIMRELSKYRRCKLLILPNRENIPGALGGILGLADILVVSGDSISMVSEAASAGKKVVAFFVEHQNKIPFEQTKHGRCLEQLASDGYILLSDVKYMKESIYKLVKNKVRIKKLDDTAVLLESLQALI
jgi:KDO2-lipid IV(A) lauroyltransferase